MEHTNWPGVPSPHHHTGGSQSLWHHSQCRFWRIKNLREKDSDGEENKIRGNFFSVHKIYFWIFENVFHYRKKCQTNYNLECKNICRNIQMLTRYGLQWRVFESIEIKSSCPRNICLYVLKYKNIYLQCYLFPGPEVVNKCVCICAPRYKWKLFWKRRVILQKSNGNAENL